MLIQTHTCLSSQNNSYPATASIHILTMYMYQSNPKTKVIGPKQNVPNLSNDEELKYL